MKMNFNINGVIDTKDYEKFRNITKQLDEIMKSGMVFSGRDLEKINQKKSMLLGIEHLAYELNN